VMQKKVWIVPCSGIGKSYGSVARESAFIVAEDLRPGTTGIVALSRLVPEDSDARAEITRATCITIDGCKLACAANVVGGTGGTVAHALQVLDFYRAHRELKPAGIAQLNDNGKKLAAVLAGNVAALVDSGEEMAEGTVTRLATLKVLETMRPGETVTICLPLFLAGGEGERAFARHYPTIAIDGCEKRCAAKGTEQYSSRLAASIVVTDICNEPGGFGTARRLNEAGLAAVDSVAEEIAAQADWLLGKTPGRKSQPAEDSLPVIQDTPATCSCGSGVPVRILEIAGRKVEVLALPLIFDAFRQSGKFPGTGTSAELMETVRHYNHIPEDEHSTWKEVIDQEYAAYFEQEAR
jgi:uncharacterized metal-binding protein